MKLHSALLPQVNRESIIHWELRLLSTLGFMASIKHLLAVTASFQHPPGARAETTALTLPSQSIITWQKHWEAIITAALATSEWSSSELTYIFLHYVSWFLLQCFFLLHNSYQNWTKQTLMNDFLINSYWFYNQYTLQRTRRFYLQHNDSTWNKNTRWSFF